MILIPTHIFPSELVFSLFVLVLADWFNTGVKSISKWCKLRSNWHLLEVGQIDHLFHRPLLLPYLHVRYFGSHQQIWAVCVEIEFKCWNLKWIDNKAVASALCTRPRKVPLGKSWESEDPLFREREFRHDLRTVCVCVCALVCYCVYMHVCMCVRVRTCVSQCVRMCVFVVSVCVLPLGTISGEREARISDYRPPPPPPALHTSTEKLCTNTIAHFAHFGTSANLPHTKKANLLFGEFMEQIFIWMCNLKIYGWIDEEVKWFTNELNSPFRKG